MTHETKIYDQHGSDHDAAGNPYDEAWLAAQYDGCHIEHATQSKAFRILEIRVTEGPATFMADVRNETGAPHAMQPVAFSWPSLSNPAPDLPDLTGSGAVKVWTARGVHQKTDGNGLTGFGLGGSYGPLYQAWIISPTLASDCIVGSGMKGGTNHRGPLRVLWQIHDDNEPEPEPGPGDLAETNALLREIRDLIKAGFRL